MSAAKTIERAHILLFLLGCFGAEASMGCGEDDDGDDGGATSAATASGSGGCGDQGGNEGGGGAATGTGGGPGSGGSTGGAGEVIPLKEAKLNIEHNATDLDTGFQGFIDSEGWERLDVTGPGGLVLSFEGHGTLGTLGLTELFFETVEPENAEVPLEEMLTQLPEGEYTIEGPTPDGGWTSAKALLTHDIPAGPVLVTPAEGSTVAHTAVVVSWEPVTETITGESVNIVAYQLIVEVDAPPHPHAIGKKELSVYLPPTATSMTLPPEFMLPGTAYKWEVLAIEESGNQTLSSGAFDTL